MEKLIPIAVLSLGGAFGVNARYWLGVWISRWASPQFPWATFVINITGSFAIGFLATLFTRWLPHPNVRLLVITGFLGGYTTYSSFAFESQTRWESGEKITSIGYMAATLVAGFLAVWIGVLLARGFTTPSAARATASDRAVHGDARAGSPGSIDEPKEAR